MSVPLLPPTAQLLLHGWLLQGAGRLDYCQVMFLLLTQQRNAAQHRPVSLSGAWAAGFDLLLLGKRKGGEERIKRQ